ncbi:hypothetical protein [Streptomyces lunaelactis]|uniref:hypothetical protein n=1 Tax=Streptomyces lunaelactis TaxID=1535768 RepID=UPI0028155DFC|nr:hypothetical protein [Streptomyces lunaelactis]
MAQEALKTGRSVSELVLDKGLLTKDELQFILLPNNLVRPHVQTTTVGALGGPLPD